MIDKPYPGLRPFECDDALTFFGREAQVRMLLQKLNENAFVAVVGSSGSGKSSLVRAGLLPLLDQGALRGSKRWIAVVMKPGADPYGNLAQSLRRELQRSGECKGRLSSTDSDSEEAARARLKANVCDGIIYRVIEQEKGERNRGANVEYP